MSINTEFQSEFERQIITMLIGGDNNFRKEHILEHLCQGMFTNSLYRNLYDSISNLYISGKEINLVNVCENLKLDDQKRFAIDLDKEFITNANCNFYLSKLLDNYIERLVIDCKSLEGYKKIEQIKNKFELKQYIKSISDGADKLIPDYYKNWEKALQTGYPSIDRKLGSLLGGDLLILAGAPGMGKTCMMLNLLMNMAKNNKKILLFSLEMKLPQLQNRIISAKTNVPSDKIRKFNMDETEIEKYNNFAVCEEFTVAPIKVCDNFNLTVKKIRSIIFQDNPDIVMIDYLGLIKGERNNEYENVSEISRELKVLAGDCNLPFIVLHQLNRASSDRKDKRPQLSDLRGSGKIEQDADFVCFVYRPAYYGENNSSKQELEFLIAKSRHGDGRARVKLCFHGEKQLITDPELFSKEASQCSLVY